MWLLATIIAFHKEDDYAKKPVRLKKRFLRCAMLRIAPVEMTGAARRSASLRSKCCRSNGTYEMRGTILSDSGNKEKSPCGTGRDIPLYTFCTFLKYSRGAAQGRGYID